SDWLKQLYQSLLKEACELVTSNSPGVNTWAREMAFSATMIDQHPEKAPADQAQANEPPAQDGSTRGRDRLPLFIRRLDWKLIGTILAIKVLFYWYGTQAYQVLTNS